MGSTESEQTLVRREAISFPRDMHHADLVLHCQDGACRVSSSLLSASSRYLRQLLAESQFRSEGHATVLDNRVELSLPWASKEQVDLLAQFLSTGMVTVHNAGTSSRLWDLLRMLRVDVVRWEEIVVEEKDLTGEAKDRDRDPKMSHTRRSGASQKRGGAGKSSINQSVTSQSQNVPSAMEVNPSEASPTASAKAVPQQQQNRKTTAVSLKQQQDKKTAAANSIAASVVMTALPLPASESEDQSVLHSATKSNPSKKKKKKKPVELSSSEAVPVSFESPRNRPSARAAVRASSRTSSSSTVEREAERNYRKDTPSPSRQPDINGANQLLAMLPSIQVSKLKPVLVAEATNGGEENGGIGKPRKKRRTLSAASPSPASTVKCDDSFKKRLKRRRSSSVLSQQPATEDTDEGNTNNADGDVAKEEYRCIECEKVLNSRAALWYHSKMHADSSRFYCASCRSFYPVKKRVAHLRLKHSASSVDLKAKETIIFPPVAPADGKAKRRRGRPARSAGGTFLTDPEKTVKRLRTVVSHKKKIRPPAKEVNTTEAAPANSSQKAAPVHTTREASNKSDSTPPPKPVSVTPQKSPAAPSPLKPPILVVAAQNPGVPTPPAPEPAQSGPAAASPTHLVFCMTCDRLISAEKMERHAPLGHDTVKIADTRATSNKPAGKPAACGSLQSGDGAVKQPVAPRLLPRPSIQLPPPPSLSLSVTQRPPPPSFPRSPMQLPSRSPMHVSSSSPNRSDQRPNKEGSKPTSVTSTTMLSTDSVVLASLKTEAPEAEDYSPGIASAATVANLADDEEDRGRPISSFGAPLLMGSGAFSLIALNRNNSSLTRNKSFANSSGNDSTTACPPAEAPPVKLEVDKGDD